ncbi:synaptonemal complex protein 2 isoform X4 [Trichomycterus rosablanca]|uniref:synaptonemal complex protein 2 isoform X4 n=1 Tax=Trichomycterus rosablanca TaxID=2290929 RepID=UPI002F357A68
MPPYQYHQVEKLVDQALKHRNFNDLEAFLLNETKDGAALKCSKQFIFKLDKLVNRELEEQNVKHASVVLTLLHKLGDTLVFPGGEGVLVMVSQALVRKMVQWFEKARRLWIEAGPLRNEALVNLAEDFFDALMVVYKSCKDGTYQVTESLLYPIGKLASDAQVNIMIQKEAVRKLNLILGKIPTELKKEKKLLSSQEASSVMHYLACRILKGGDYDLQVALMEALCRMTPRAQRREMADRWFRMEFVATAFSQIKDSEFETDCRKFLNLLNGLQGDGRSVYSYPCLEVFLDKHALFMPVDENLHEFWIDFNLESQSISFYFCLADDQQEGQWDTLCIAENEIHSYTVQEEKDVKVLQLILIEPVCLTNIEGYRLTIHFSSSLDILEATKKVYGETKNKKFIGKTTTSVVKTTVQIILDEGGSQVLFPESQGSSQLMEKTAASVKNGTHCQSLKTHEKDAQRVSQQMITPLRKKVSESCMYVSDSAGRKVGKSPFSCVLPVSTPCGKAKVKPALEMVASTEKKKMFDLREHLIAKSSNSVASITATPKVKPTTLTAEQFQAGQSANKKQDRKDNKRHIPVEKVLEMVHTDEEYQEEALDPSIVPDSQPVMQNKTSLLPGLSHIVNKRRISVSGSLVSCQSESSHQSKSECFQQSSSAQCGSGKLSHKQLHTELTQRLEQIVRAREEQGQHPTEPKVTGNLPKSIIDHQKPTQVQASMSTESSRSVQAVEHVTDTSKNTKASKAAASMVKQIHSHYKSTAFSKATSQQASQFNIALTNRHSFTKSWCPNSVVKIPANTPGGFLKSCDQSKKINNKDDVYQFSVDQPEPSEKNKRSSEKPKRESSVCSNSLILSSSAKKCPPAKPTGRAVKKHLFSDTDTDYMTEVSWLKSANRKPKPKVADYTRQPVKPTRQPDITSDTPNAAVASPKAVKALPKLKRKRQKKVVEKVVEKSEDVASRKSTGRPQRIGALTKSYKEPSDSESLSETNEPPPAKKLIQQPEKPHRTALQDKSATEHNVKIKNQLMLKMGQKALNKRKKKVLPSPEPRTEKMIIPDSLECSKIQKKIVSPQRSFHLSPPSSDKIKSDKSTELTRSPLTFIHPLSKKSTTKKPKKPQKLQPAFVKAFEAENIENLNEQPEKENKRPGETTHSEPKNKKCSTYLEAANHHKDSWFSKYASTPSPFSIEKMRSAEKKVSIPRSPSTPLQPLCISPVGPVSSPLEPPSHLKGIQASSFYKSSGGRNSVKSMSRPPLTPAAKKQRAAEDVEQGLASFVVHPLIASTGKEKHSSPLNTPALEDDLRSLLNSASQGVLQTCFDKESVISLVTLSQSSHTSVNIDMIFTEYEKTPESKQGGQNGEAQSGPTTAQKRHSSCNSTSLSEQEDSDEEERKVGPREFATRMKPRKLFKFTDKPCSMRKDAREPILHDSSSEEGDEDKALAGSVQMRSTVSTKMVSSCYEASGGADTDPEVSTSQEMGYVCHQFSSELKRKFENRYKRMDGFTKQSLKMCKQLVSSISLKVHKYRSQKLETVKRVLLDEIKSLEQDDTALRKMEEELTTYWKKQALALHAYQERGTQRLKHLKSTIETNVCHSVEYEERIFSSQMHLMKKDMKSVQDRLFKQMHEEELLSVRRGLQTLFFSDVF